VELVGEFARARRTSYDRNVRLVQALVLVVASTTFADTKKQPSNQPKPPREVVVRPAGEVVEVTHKEGEYGGVTPGQPPHPDPRQRPTRPPPKGTLSWIGFEAKNGGAEVFFQSAAQFDVSQHVEGSTLVVYLGLNRLGHNTWRQIDTRYFDNPIAGIVARGVGPAQAQKGRPAHKAGIEVRVTFKNPKDAHEATVRTATEADGMFYTYLEFPEGAEASQTPATSPTKASPDVEK
jgi:hypothetical protein